MFYIYAIVVLLLVGLALWVILCFNNVLQQQRQMNFVWGQVTALLDERDSIIGDFQNLWVSPDAPAPDARLAHLQELLVADASLDWSEVEARAALRQQIETELLQLMGVAQENPALAQGAQLAQVQQQLRDNGMMLAKEAELYNRHVRVYNGLLSINPNRAIAQKTGHAPAPLYAI